MWKREKENECVGERKGASKRVRGRRSMNVCVKERERE